MDTKCNGCAEAIINVLHMQCSRDKCKKLYHLNCLALSEPQFEAFTLEYKKRWVCPECTCTIPKKGNSETPVRGNTAVGETHTPSYVNTERGSRRNPKEVTVIDSGNQVLDELREFRLEIKTRLDEQTKEFILLKNKLVNTETELRDLKSILKVVQEKANKVDILETRIKVLLEKNGQLETSLTARNITEKSETKERSERPLSFANIVKESQPEVVGNFVPVKECVATKSANIVTTGKKQETNRERSLNRPINVIEKENEDPVKEEKWTLVNRKKNRYPNSEVRKGGSVGSTEIQGTERKKYLHVWRLQKETTVENLEKHVKTLYREAVPIKIEKIKHKTERDYASFIIGVPESKYEVLCQPESWAVNIEFCEWVWFRRQTNKQKPPE